jgi:hypothetical protein
MSPTRSGSTAAELANTSPPTKSDRERLAAGTEARRCVSAAALEALAYVGIADSCRCMAAISANGSRSFIRAKSPTTLSPVNDGDTSPAPALPAARPRTATAEHELRKKDLQNERMAAPEKEERRTV